MDNNQWYFITITKTNTKSKDISITITVTKTKRHTKTNIVTVHCHMPYRQHSTCNVTCSSLNLTKSWQNLCGKTSSNDFILLLIHLLLISVHFLLLLVFLILLWHLCSCHPRQSPCLRWRTLHLSGCKHLMQLVALNAVIVKFQCKSLRVFIILYITVRFPEVANKSGNI